MAKIFRGYSVDIDYRLSARARPGLNMAVDKTMMMMRQAAIESANQKYMGDFLSLFLRQSIRFPFVGARLYLRRQ